MEIRTYVIDENMSEEERSSIYWLNVLEEHPNSSAALNNLGNSFHFEGNRKEAMMAFEKAVKINPDQAETYYNLAILLTESKEFPHAESMCKKALSLDPLNPFYHTCLGNIFVKEGKDNDALRVYEKTAHLGDPKAAFCMSIVHREAGNLRKAEEAYGLYIELVNYLGNYDTKQN